MIPTPGRIVAYTLAGQDAEQINRRRKDALDQAAWHREHKTGAMVHTGNAVREGDVYPLIITRAWGATEGSGVNGQVLLDGSDTFWATSVTEGEGPRTWAEFPRLGQP